MLIGGTGTGKTHLAVSIARACIRNGRHGRFFNVVDLVNKLYKLFVERDAEMLEINPLIVTTDGDMKCLDAKMGFDSNALYRQADILALRDETE